MNTQTHEHKTQVESISQDRIVLDAGGNFPREVIYKNKRGETIKYRLVKTKFDCLTLNK